MQSLPTLLSDGRVVFETPAVFVSSFHSFLVKGGLAVRPEQALAPLTELDFTLEIPGQKVGAPMRAQVVGLTSDRAVLRLLTPVPEAAYLAATELLDVAMPMPTVDSNAPAHALAPASGGPASVDLPPLAPPPVTAVTAGPEPISALETPPAAVPANLPPEFDLVPDTLPGPAAVDDSEPELKSAQPHRGAPRLFDDHLNFDSIADVESARRDLGSMGVLLALSDLPVVGARALLLSTADAKLKSAIDVDIAPASEGALLVTPKDAHAFDIALEALVTLASRPRAAHGDAETQSVTAVFATEGALVHPETPGDVLGLPLLREPTPDEVRSPTAVLLVRWLMVQDGLAEVTLSFPAGDSTRFVVSGETIHASTEFGVVARTAAQAGGHYQVTVLPEVPTACRKTMGPVEFIGQLVRGLTSNFDDATLEAAFSDQLDRAPVLNARGQRMAKRLSFAGSRLRFAERRLDGTESLRTMLGSQLGSRAVWDVVFTLSAFEGLEWKAVKGTTPSTAPRQVSEAERAFQVMAGRDHFEVLGLHWASAPAVITPTYEEKRARFAEGSHLATAEPEWCRKICARLDEAHRVLSDTPARRRYRRDTYTYAWSAQAEILLNKAKLSLYRDELKDGLHTLQAILDILPRHEEAKALMKKTIDKEKKKRAALS